MKTAIPYQFACWAAAAAVTLLRPAAAGDRWPVPDHYFSRDTVVFAEIDISNITVDKLKDSLGGLFSKEELRKYRVESDPDEVFDHAKRKLDEKRKSLERFQGYVADPISKIGDSIYVFLAVPEGDKDPRLHLLVPIKDSEKLEDAQDFLARFAIAEAKAKLGKLGAAVYQDLHYVAEKDRTDSWLVFSPAGTPPAKEWWSPARQKLFLGALALVEKDPIRVVMKSNFAVSDKTVAMARAGREKSRGVGAAAALDIAERVNRAKWIGIRMDVGNRPTATISAQMSSVADAFAVQLTYNNKVLPDMITRAKERDRKARQKAEEEDEEYDPKITALQMAETFKAAFRMERNEELLTIRLSSLDMQRLSASLLATVEDLIGKITAETIDSLFEEDDSPDPEP